MRRALIAVLALGLGGCSLLFGVDDYTVGGAADAGPRVDGGDDDAGPSGVDGGPGDAGPPGVDGGPPDAGPPALCQTAADGCDLTISCSMPASVVGAGESVRVPFSVTNLGMVSGAGIFEVEVEMDMGGTFVSVGTVSSAGVVMPLGTFMGEVSFVSPGWILNGQTELRCTVDSMDMVPEADEMNNTATTMLIATGLPNLHLPFVSISSNPSNPFTPQIDIRNSGPVATGSFRYLISGGGAGGGGTLGSETIMAGLNAMTTLRVAPTVSHMLGGAGTVNVVVDPTPIPNGEVMESNESDNRFTRNVTW